MLRKIFKRARQFFRAITAKISAEDGRYLTEHLTRDEQNLFFSMSTADQFHCLRTAYTIERIVIQDKKGVDKNFLIRCALLHDVGRIKGDMSVMQKVFAVLITSFFPNFAKKLERDGNRTLYIYKHHAEIGAKKLQKIGLYRESKIVANHHSPPKPNDSRELKLLRLADEEN